MAARAAIAAWRNPQPDSATSDIRGRLNLLWSYYDNTVFDSVAAWAAYRSNYVLYRNIRSIYNPTRRLVNFYVAQVYPGVLSEDATKLPEDRAAYSRLVYADTKRQRASLVDRLLGSLNLYPAISRHLAQRLSSLSSVLNVHFLLTFPLSQYLRSLSLIRHTR